MSKYTYNQLLWDTEYFNCRSSRIDITNLLNEKDFIDIKRIIQEDEFITITNSKKMMNNNRLITQQLGAYLVDINIRLVNSNIRNYRCEQLNHISICNSHPYDDKIINLVENSFIYSRFYNDTVLSIQNDKVSGVYTNWIKNSFDKEDKYFCTYTTNGVIKGFILFSCSNRKTIIIELVAVDTSVQNNGIGTNLIKSVYNFCLDKNYEQVCVGTQLENIRALNFYIKNDFHIKEISYIYHLWNFEKKEG